MPDDFRWGKLNAMMLDHAAQTVDDVTLWCSCDKLDTSDMALKDIGIY